MIPAEVKKQENIAEYIIHMYQTEDLITTYAFNLDDILEYVIKHMSKDEQELKKLLLWYAGIIEEMQAENLPEPGRRLRSTQKFVRELIKIHERLLSTEPAYQKIYASAKADIATQIEASNGQVSEPIQVCLNAVYGKLVINLNGKKLPVAHEQMVERLASVLAFITRQYHSSE